MSVDIFGTQRPEATRKGMAQLCLTESLCGLSCCYLVGLLFNGLSKPNS